MAVFMAMLALYFFSYFQRVGVPGTIFNELQVEVGLSAVSIAMLGSMFTWIYGAMQIVVGFAADRHGGARAFLVGGALLVAFALAGDEAPGNDIKHDRRSARCFELGAEVVVADE